MPRPAKSRHRGNIVQDVEADLLFIGFEARCQRVSNAGTTLVVT
jgi:hypothetical protein